MKCYYIYDNIGGKVLIPGCWGTVHSGNIEDCYCDRLNKKTIEQRVSELESELKVIKDNLKKNILMKEDVKNALMEAIWISRWNKQESALIAVLTEDEAEQMCKDIAIELDKLGYEIKQK